MADVIAFPERRRSQPEPLPEIPDCPFQADAEMRLRLAQQGIRAVACQERSGLASPWTEVCEGAARLIDEAQALIRRSLEIARRGGK